MIICFENWLFPHYRQPYHLSLHIKISRRLAVLSNMLDQNSKNLTFLGQKIFIDFYELYKSLKYDKVVGANKPPTKKEITLALSWVLNHTASSTKRAHGCRIICPSVPR